MTMTPPNYIMNMNMTNHPVVSPFPGTGTLKDLENAVVSSLARKFALGDAIPIKFPLIDATTDEVINTCPLTPKQVYDDDTVYTNIEDYPMTVTPQSSPGPIEYSIAEAHNSIMTNKRPITPDQAAGVVDTALEDVATTPSTTEPPSKRARTSNSNGMLPSAADPTDNSFCMSLHSEDDEGKINPTHNAIRRDVLEIRRTKAGNVFFQCACCKHLPRQDRAKQSMVGPQNIDGLYRAMIRFKTHVQACEHIPQHIKDAANNTRGCKSGTRGSRAYWSESAKMKGLVDIDGGGGGIAYCSPRTEYIVCEAYHGSSIRVTCS